MGLVSLTPHVAGTVLTAAALNSNDNAIINQVNGNLETVNFANLSVTSAILASNSVTTTKILDAAVTGPKIAMGSDAQGDILIRGASNYQRLATGTSGQLLSAQGAGANPQWIDNPGKWIAVQTGVVTTAANFTISSLVAGAKYKLVFELLQNTSAGYPTLKFNGDGGANYSWSARAGHAEGDTKIILANSAADTTDVAGYFYGFIDFLSNAANKAFVSGVAGTLNGGATLTIYNASTYVGSAAISNLTLATSGGTWTGTWSLYRLS